MERQTLINRASLCPVVGGTVFEVQTTESLDVVRSIVADALTDAGYQQRTALGGLLHFRRGPLRDSKIFAGRHDILVNTAPTEGGARLTVTLKTQLGTRKDQVKHLERHFEALIKRAVSPGPVIVGGVVAKDGAEVQLDHRLAGVDFGPRINRIPENKPGEALGSAILGVVFVFMGVAAWLWFPPSLHGWRAGAVAVLGPLLGAVTLVYGLRNMYSKSSPDRIALSLEGLGLMYPRRPTATVPWAQIDGVQQPKRVPGSWDVLWREAGLSAKKPHRRIHVSQELAEEIEDFRGFARVAGKPGERPLFDAFSLLPPGTRVLVADRPLSAPEMKHRQLVRRFLPKGPVANIYVSLTDDGRLVREFVQRNPPKTAEAFQDFSATAASSSMWGLAAEMLERAASLRPDDAGLEVDLVGCLLQAERTEEARSVAEASLRKRGDSTGLHEQLARIARKQNRDEDARRHVSRAVELEPNNLGAIEQWIDLVAEGGDRSQAVAEIDYVSTQNPNAWAPHLAVGRELFGAGSREAGRQRIEKAFEIDVNGDTLHAMAGLRLAQDQPLEAVRLIDQARERGPISPAVALDLATALARAGQTTRAVQYLQEVKPELPLAYRDAARELLARLTQAA